MYDNKFYIASVLGYRWIAFLKFLPVDASISTGEHSSCIMKHIFNAYMVENINQKG